MQQDMKENVQEEFQRTDATAVEVEAGALNADSVETADHEAAERADSKSDAIAALAMTAIILLATIFWLQGL